MARAHAGRADERHALVGHERPVEDRVLARRRAHAERVPGLLDPVARRVAGQERVDDARAGRVARVHAVQPEVRPDGREAAEGLATGELPPSLDPLRACRREEQRDVVAGLAVAGSEHVACGRLLEEPAEARVAGAVELRGDTRPVEVHVDRERGRGSDVGEPALDAVPPARASAPARRSPPGSPGRGSPRREARRSPPGRSGSRRRSRVPAHRSGRAARRSGSRRQRSSSVGHRGLLRVGETVAADRRGARSAAS